jgi:hypothetical protein
MSYCGWKEEILHQLIDGLSPYLSPYLNKMVMQDKPIFIYPLDKMVYPWDGRVYTLDR